MFNCTAWGSRLLCCRIKTVYRFIGVQNCRRVSVAGLSRIRKLAYGLFLWVSPCEYFPEIKLARQINKFVSRPRPHGPPPPPRSSPPKWAPSSLARLLNGRCAHQNNRKLTGKGWFLYGTPEESDRQLNQKTGGKHFPRVPPMDRARLLGGTVAPNIGGRPAQLARVDTAVATR